MKLLAWLLGFRIIERDYQHVVVKMPLFLCSEEQKRAIANRVKRDYELVENEPLKVTIGHRYIRFDGKNRDTRKIKIRRFERGV